MKLCDKCGALNSDERAFCVDCGEKLGDILTESEENKIENDIDSSLERLYNDGDPLYVSRLDKIVGYAALVGFAADIILLFIFAINRRETVGLWIGLILFVLSFAEAFFPKINWAIEKMRLSLVIGNPDDAVPSDFYRLCRKFSILITASIGAVLLILSVMGLRKPPVLRYVSEIANTKSVAYSSNCADYINANPDKWEEIIDGGQYTVSVFLGELEKAESTGLEEHIMMTAIAEITEKDDLSFSDKDSFLFSYRTSGWD